MIVEDGTGMTDSNSYVEVDYADNYFLARGKSEWQSLETERKESALICATDYVDATFRWNGNKKTAEQALRFPRINLFDYEGCLVEGIPTALKQAVCECAFILSQGTELFQVESENGNVVSETIGSLSFTYDSKAKDTNKSLYNSVNAKLRGLYSDRANGGILSARVRRT